MAQQKYRLAYLYAKQNMFHYFTQYNLNEAFNFT